MYYIYTVPLLKPNEMYNLRVKRNSKVVQVLHHHSKPNDILILNVFLDALLLHASLLLADVLFGSHFSLKLFTINTDFNNR